MGKIVKEEYKTKVFQFGYSSEIIRDIVEAIPSSWLSINGILCTPQIYEDTVKGGLWKIRGISVTDVNAVVKSENSDRLPAHCQHWSQESCLNLGQLIDRSAGSLDLLLQKNRPCGISFENAGSWTDEDFKRVRKLLGYFLEQNYQIKDFSAVSGHYNRPGRRLYDLYSAVDSYTGLRVAPENIHLVSTHNSDGTGGTIHMCEIHLDYNREFNGKIKNLETFLEVMKKHSIKELK